MTEIKLIISLVIPVLAGQLLLWALFGRKYFSGPLSLALAYGLGTGALSQVMLLLGVLQVPFSPVMIDIGLSLLVFTVLIICKKIVHPTDLFLPQKDSPLSRTEILLWIFILYQAVIIFWRSWDIPIYAWDSIATIAFKAKIFFYQKNLVPLNLLPHGSYPLHVPFQQTWIALNLGKWDDQAVNFFLPFTFCAYLTIHYAFLRFLTNRIWALLGTALLVTSSQFTFFATVPYREFTLIYYNVTAVMALILWKRTRVDAFLVLAGVLSGFASFTKLEGTAYLAIHALLFLILLNQSGFAFKEKITKSLKFLVPSLTMSLFFLFYKILSGFPTSERTQIDLAWANAAARIPIILGAFLKALLFTGNWNIIWFLLLVSYLNLVRKKWAGEIQWLTLVLGMFFGLYFLVYFLTSVNFNIIAVQKDDAEIIPRIILHIYPLAPLLIILLNFPTANKNIRR